MSNQQNDIYLEQLENEIRNNLRASREEIGIPLEYLAQIISEELGEADTSALIEELRRK